MNKRLLLIASAALLLSCSSEQLSSKTGPRFNEDGSFKIVQFTDLHLVANRPEERIKTLSRFERLAKIENPDLIVITGDATFGGVRADTCLTELFARIDKVGKPFILLYGNHDAEQQIPRTEMSERICEQPLSLNTLNPEGELADIEMNILSHSSDSVAYALYGLDSHDYPKTPGSGTYAWLSFDQVEWFRRASAALEASEGHTVPSLAFFHIPLREFRQLGSSGNFIGSRLENEACSDYNSGMFLAMRESNSVQGIFCGHDHNNDYIGTFGGIALAYGLYGGDNTVYHDLEQSGLRAIVLREGEKGFETWLRQDDGSIINKVRFKDGKLEME